MMYIEEESLAMELVATVYSIPTTTETRLCHCGEEARKERTIERRELLDDGDDGSEIVYAETPRCCLIVPPAIPIGRPSTIDARISGINSAITARIVVQQHSEILCEKTLQRQEISTGTIKLDLPELYEGTVTFYLIVEDALVHGVPVCVVPAPVVEDIKGLLSTMVSVTRSSQSLPEDTNEGALFQMVWLESFSCFLADVDVLFEWLSDGQGPVDLVMDILMNMLRQCCTYEAWEFAAYVINKAAEYGVEIISDLEATVPFTAASLKATVCENQSEQVCKMDEQTNMASNFSEECDEAPLHQ